MRALLTERLAVVATIDPDAYDTGANTSDWINMESFASVMFVVMVGTLGSSGTVDFKVQEATDGSGTSNTDLSSKSITQLTDAGTDDDKQAVVHVRAEELSSGYTHVAGVMTVGTAASDAAMVAIAGDPRYLAASNFDLSSVDEIVT